MPQSDLPLPDRLEQECARAGKTRQPVFLVGADRSLLERVAKRIHALTDDSWTVGQYVSLSCRSSTLSKVPMVATVGPGTTSIEANNSLVDMTVDSTRIWPKSKPNHRLLLAKRCVCLTK